MAKGYLYDNGDELISREDVLPATTGASSGDVLSLDSSKKPVWSAPSGGVSLTDSSYSASNDRIVFYGENFTPLALSEVINRVKNGGLFSTPLGVYRLSIMENQGQEICFGNIGDVDTTYCYLVTVQFTSSDETFLSTSGFETKKWQLDTQSQNTH